MKQNPELTKDQRAVLFDKATEPPFSGKYNLTFENGTYVCANCQTPLFLSDDKFKSNCGWPSFDQAIQDKVNLTPDYSFGMVRTEVTCKTCGGHLGHVFDDGPIETTGQRFCINSLAIDLAPETQSTTLPKEN